MRKPVSKHAIRRALEQVIEEGMIQIDEPIGTVVDRLWHFVEREAFEGNPRKKQPAPIPRDLVDA
jgi:DNA-binding GntR family transcriptional regulator